MPGRSGLLTLLVAAALSGCQDEPSEGRQAKPAAKAVDLPYLTGTDGTRIPYFEYEADDLSVLDDSDAELAVFVYPILEDRSRGLALPHPPGQDVKELFCCGELSGRDFEVVVERGVLLVDDIPVSRPIDLNAGSKWKMTYAEATYDCGVAQPVGDDFIIGCASDKFVLNHRFDKVRGFTSFQELCGQAPQQPATQVCTYSLESSVGLLSPYHVRLLTEPSGTGSKAGAGN